VNREWIGEEVQEFIKYVTSTGKSPCRLPLTVIHLKEVNGALENDGNIHKL